MLNMSPDCSSGITVNDALAKEEFLMYNSSSTSTDVSYSVTDFFYNQFSSYAYC